MLHKDEFIIAPDTFKLIVALQQWDFLEQFYLVGGTALALQLGHRNSIDIDLFTNEEYDTDELFHRLSQHYEVVSTFQRKNTLLTFINGVKVDFVRHNYPLPLLHEPMTVDGITMLGLEDIGAMKLHAISNSGKRLKDFIDVYFLLERFSMDQLVSFYAAKYPNFNPMIALRSVSYFGDIDPALDPPKMARPLPLEKIKKRIRDAVLHSGKLFG